jgi:3-oxoadipate enol-lactonase
MFIRDRAETVRSAGLEAIADKVVARWFTNNVQPETVVQFRSLLVSTPAEGYAGCCEALAGWDFRGRLAEIRADTLVIAGAEDAAAPLRDSELLVERIPRARLVVVEQAAHLANVEQPESFANVVLDAVPEAV